MRGNVFSSQDSLRLWFMLRVTGGSSGGHKCGGRLQMGGIHPNTEGAYCYFCLLLGNPKRGQAATGSAARPRPVAPGALAACVPGVSFLPLAAPDLPRSLFRVGYPPCGFRHSVKESPDDHFAYVGPDVLSLLLPRGALRTLLSYFVSESSVRMP